MIAAPELAGRSVLIWGIGRHWGGVAAADFCARAGAHVALLDAKAPEELGEPGAEVRRRGWTTHVGDATRWVHDPESYKVGGAGGVSFVQRSVAYWTDGKDERVTVEHGDTGLFPLWGFRGDG